MQELLAKSLGNITSSIGLVTRVSQMLDEGVQRDEHSALAKEFTTSRMRETVAWCRELFGGNGIVIDYGVIKFFSDAEAIYSYEGTREMNTLIVGGLQALVAHGRAFLAPEEYDCCFERDLSEYYNLLAVTVMQGRRDQRFWAYHKAKLAEAGLGFSRSRLAKAASEVGGPCSPFAGRPFRLASQRQSRCGLISICDPSSVGANQHIKVRKMWNLARVLAAS